METISKPPFIMKFTLCCLVFFLVGCSQDPLSGLDTSIKDQFDRLADMEPQKSEEAEEEDNKKIVEYFGRIIADDLWQVSTTEELQAVITAKIFLEEDQFDDFEVQLKDDAFAEEDYTFEKMKDISKVERQYLFKWTPSEDFLEGGQEKYTQVQFQLKTTGKLILESTDQFKLIVTKRFQALTLQIVDMPSTLREGDHGIMVVHVFDPQEKNKSPVLTLNHVASGGEEIRDLNRLLTFVEKNKIDENIWEFRYRIKTDILEAGLSRANYALNMFANSINGVSSKTHQVTLTVFNRVLIPKVTGPNIVALYSGETTSLLIQVLDPLASGELSAKILTEESDNISGDIGFYYETTPQGILVYIHWFIPEDTKVPQDSRLLIEISNQGMENNQSRLESVVHTISAKILSKR